MSKYTIVAYILWITLGWFGTHLFYLGKEHQGILWLTSFSGLFGIGWLRDMYRIPSYVKEANNDREFMLRRSFESRKKRPSVWSNNHRVVAQVLFGIFYRKLIFLSLPEEYADVWYIVTPILPLGTAFGAYMVSSTGNIKCPLRYSLAGAYVGEICFGHPCWFLDDSCPSLGAGVCALFSTFAWHRDRRTGVVRRDKCCKRTCKRLVVWMFCAVMFSIIAVSAFYFNGSIETEDGETVKLRVVLNNFFRSPYWKQLKNSFWMNLDDVWKEYKEKGLEGAKKRLMMLADIQGKERSRMILGLERNATMKELKAMYRKLAKEWHPDRHIFVSEEDKVHVTAKFIEIQEAYEIFKSVIKKRESSSGSSGINIDAD